MTGQECQRSRSGRGTTSSPTLHSATATGGANQLMNCGEPTLFSTMSSADVARALANSACEPLRRARQMRAARTTKPIRSIESSAALTGTVPGPVTSKVLMAVLYVIATSWRPDAASTHGVAATDSTWRPRLPWTFRKLRRLACLLYTSDAADDLLCVDLGGR